VISKVRGIKRCSVNRYADLLLVGLIVLSLAAYLYNLGGWLMDDDEGSYLYAAWRISLGEVPYRDFLTPQLPGFLYTGAALFRAFGTSPLPVRVSTVLAAHAAALFLYLLARQAFNPWVALLGTLFFLAHDTVYEVAREFRPESYMLLFTTAGAYAFLRSFPTGRRLGLTLAGVCFGLALISKLFAGLALAGAGLWALYLIWRQKLSLGQAARHGLWFGVPLLLVAGSVFSGFYLLSTNLPTAVVGHHLRQGRELPPWQVAGKALVFYWGYFWLYPWALLLAGLGALRAWRSGDPQKAFYTLQLPTVLAFLGLSRQLWDRHMMYLLPAIGPLFAYGIGELLRLPKSQRLRNSVTGHSGFSRSGRLQSSLRTLWGQPVARLLVAMAIVLTGWALAERDLHIARRVDTGTPALAELIRSTTAPDDLVVTDYSGLNFYAQRKTTYSAASLSQGAAMSGQISGHDLVRQMQEGHTSLVLMQAPGGQLYFLRDYLYFRQYVQTHYHFEGIFDRTGETHRIYRLGPPALTSLGVAFGEMRLTGYQFEETEVEPGRLLYLVLGWQPEAAPAGDYVAFVHLVDADGRIWAAHDQPLQDESGRPTSAWPAGANDLEGYGVQVIAGTPPGTYEVRVGLYVQGDQTRRLTWRDDQGGAVSSAHLTAGPRPDASEFVLGTVQVLKPSLPWWAYPLPLMQVPLPNEPDFGGRVRLMGYTLPVPTLQPGDGLGATLFWKTTREMGGDYLVRLRLRDKAGQTWAEGLFPPSSPRYPTSQWGEAEIATGQYNLIVDATAPPGEMQLFANLVTPEGQALRRNDLLVARVTISELPRSFQIPPIAHRQEADLSGYARLLGYDLKTTSDEGRKTKDEGSSFIVRPSSTLLLTLYWQGVKPTPISYAVFTHLIDVSDAIHGQHDGIPAGGKRPTTGWVRGEVIVDQHVIVVDPETAPGEYRLTVGLYDPNTWARLPILDAAGQIIGDRVMLDQPVRVER